MSEHKTNFEVRKAKSVSRMDSRQRIRQFQIQQLQQEIDQLALLVLEAKKQSDRIQAAADALGDTELSEFESELSADSKDGLKREKAGGKKSRTRSRRPIPFPVQSDFDTIRT